MGGSAFKSADNYVNDQQSGWEDLFDEIQEFMDMKEDFPSKRGKDFDGFPVHFSTSDRDEMRKLLMQLPGYTLILEDEREETAFFVHCKMWGLLNGVQSVWLYFGMHAPMKRHDDD